jgi:glucokinase
MSNNQTIIGLDIGGTKTAIVEGTKDAEILQRFEFPTQSEKPFSEISGYFFNLINETIQTSKKENRKPLAVSISIGGPLKIKEGFILDPPHLPGWHNLNLKEILDKQFPRLPVFVEHDGNAGALAEFYFGVGKDKKNLQHLIFLTFGTGCGAGLIVNGQIMHGATDTAGEIGHFRLADEGPVGFGKAGSWEGFASGKGLVMLASQMFPNRWNEKTPIRELVTDMINDDKKALKVAGEAGKWLGKGIALLIDAFNPQIIVLGSLAVVLGDRVLNSAKKIIQTEALPQAVKVCQITPSKLGNKIGDVASLMAALNSCEIKSLQNF